MIRRVSCSLILKMSLVPPYLPLSSYVPSSFGLYCIACVPWYCFISFTMFCAHVFSLMHWFFNLVSLFQVSVSKISFTLNYESYFQSKYKFNFADINRQSSETYLRQTDSASWVYACFQRYGRTTTPLLWEEICSYNIRIQFVTKRIYAQLQYFSYTKGVYAYTVRHSSGKEESLSWIVKP
jgi:hypothetical protein